MPRTRGPYNLYVRDRRYLGGRGRCVETFPTYAALARAAKDRARAAGWPTTQWMQLFDWNEGPITVLHPRGGNRAKNHPGAE